jgi:hypothetical protein
LNQVTGTGTQSHADAELARALSYRIRDHAVNANRGQQQRQQAERSHKNGRQIAQEHYCRVRNASIHRRDVVQRQVGSIARIALRTVFASDDGSTAVRTSTLTLLFASRASAADSLLLLETHKERRCKNHLKRPFFVSYQ